MGLFDSLTKRRARKRNENRIKRKSHEQKTYPEPDVQIDQIINNYGNRVYRRGRKFWGSTQARKAEGKQKLKKLITHNLIGDTTRVVMGPRQKKKKVEYKK